ncbi:MAG: STAS domain-containing protein [Fibrobacteraceae bacterium]|nr:STAS domain-containing protein [Fibrobacteraceae bacterium]
MNGKQELLTIENIENFPKARLLRFVGDLDSTNAENMSNSVISLLNEGVNAVIADFSRLRYINSTGLGALLFVNKKVKELKGTFKIANVNENVLEIIEIIGADSLLEIHKSLDEALSTLK